MKRWTCWLGAALLALTLPLAPLRAQAPQAATEKQAPSTVDRPVALPYALVAGMTIVLLVIVCMPTRKGQ